MVRGLASIVVFLLCGVMGSPLGAQDTAAKGVSGGIEAIGLGLVIVGLAVGIGLIGRSACESIARQPEMAGRVMTAMLISAALIEGAGFFALVLCLVV